MPQLLLQEPDKETSGLAQGSSRFGVPNQETPNPVSSQRLQTSSFLVVTCSLLRDCNIQPKKQPL